MLYNFPNHTKGGTYDGTSFTITVNGSPLVITGATIKMSMKLDKTSATVAKTLSTTDNSIKITDGANGTFEVPEQVIDVAAGVYYYDIQITLLDGTVKTYIDGQWKILQDITV